MRCGWSTALVGLGLLIGILVAPASGEEVTARKTRPASVGRAGIIQFHGPIDFKLSKYFQTRLSRARNDGVDLLIIEIDSPGGLLEESLEIAKQLQSIDWAYTVAFVPESAISAAALISLGCDEIVIGNKAIFGDIGAIYQGPDGAFRYIPAKMNSYLVQEAGVLASNKGRSPELVEAMIDKDVLVYWQPGNVNRMFKAVRKDAANPPKPPWELIKESAPERFLTVTGDAAIKFGIAESVANNREELAGEFHYDTNEARQYEYNATDSVVYYLNLPVITGLLVVIGLIALYIELSAPGLGAGGLVAGLCAALFFWSRFMGGTSTWLEVVLFLAGVIFLIFELFVIPGFGISGLMGLCLIVASIVMASQNFVIPHTAREWNQVVTSLLMILCSGCVVTIVATFLARRMGTLPMFNQMILAPQPDAKDDKQAPKTQHEGGKPLPSPHPDISVGDWGTAESLLRPAGRAKFHRKSFDVVSDGSFIQPGQSVRIVEIRGNRIVVAEVEEQLPDTTYPASRSE